MGATFSEVCYGDAISAAGAMCAAQYPRTTTDAAGVTAWTCSVVDGAHVAIASAGAASASTTVPVAFAACDPYEHYSDVTVLVGLGMGLCFIALAVKGSVGFLWKDF